MGRLLIPSPLPYLNGLKPLGHSVGPLLPAAACARSVRARGHARAHARGAAGRRECARARRPGPGQTRTTPGGGDSSDWSPDGEQIAFMSDRNGNFEIYVINADGTGQTRLTTSVGYFPVWSP